tara:strand:- start:781 stop:1764 length:984 start_codon:yes stop_codon:yes gene_type:complete
MTNFKAQIIRGKIIESEHIAKWTIKNANFNTILSSNNEEDLVFPRSSIKIFQAIPFIISQAHKKFNLSEKFIAMACSSHCGEKNHLKILKKWIFNLNLNPNELLCGIHNPINKKSSNNLLLSGISPSQLHNNCAGKHLAMLSGCLCKKLNYKNYVNINHPYQKLIRNSLEYFTNESIQKKQIGIDGCSAPQYAFTMNALANSMINLVNDNKKNEYTKSIKILLKAIKKNPLLIGGTNRFDSEVIKYTAGRIFCKGGAEGVILFSDTNKKIGGIIKIIDGNERAIPPITMKIFNKLKLLNLNEKKQLFHWAKPKLFNHANKKIGEIVV